MIIVPSILSDSLEVVQTQIDRVFTETNLRRVQIDIVDPEYAEEITIHPIDLLEVNLRDVLVDFHLMTNDPINDVIECSQIKGAHTLIAQIEHMPDQKAFFEHVESLELHVGLSLDMYTPVEELNTTILNKLSIIQVMGNKAGQQGEPFVSSMAIPKIKQLVDIRQNTQSSFLIAVDIGMTPENAAICSAAGADMVTPGSFLWSSENLQSAVEAFSKTL